MSERPVDVQRLEAALDRISAAFVRRAERDAAAAEEASDAASTFGHALDGPALEDIRRRLDEAIGRVRALLDESPS